MINSHYVPRLILRKFSDKLSLYNVKTGELKENISIEDVYAIEDYYDRETEKKLNTKIESQFASKQIEIASLEKSISDSKATYTLVNDDEYLRQWAETNEFVQADDTNTIVVDISKFYEQPAGPEDVPSNWFNDVCEFLSRLFA